MAGNNLSNLSRTRTAQVTLAARTGVHELYIVPYAAGGTAAPTPETNYTDIAFGPFAVAGSNEGDDLTRIDRVIVPQMGAVTYDEQELFMPVASGDERLAALMDRALTNRESAKQGERMAFWRFYNDRAFHEGDLQVVDVRPNGDPEAQDGYTAALRVLEAEFHHAVDNVEPPAGG